MFPWLRGLFYVDWAVRMLKVAYHLLESSANLCVLWLRISTTGAYDVVLSMNFCSGSFALLSFSPFSTISRRNLLKGTATTFERKPLLEPFFPEEFLPVSSFNNLEGGLVSRRTHCKKPSTERSGGPK